MNDYDRISAEMGVIIETLTGNAHEHKYMNNSDSITITKDGFISGIVKAQRLRDWVNGLSESHKYYAKETVAKIDGPELRRVRKRAKLNQAELADILGISRGYLSQIERGTQTNLSVRIYTAIKAWMNEGDWR